MTTLYFLLRSVLLCILLAFSYSIPAEELDTGQRETPVNDPIGLGERLALIDYLRDNKKVKIPQESSLQDLRRIYWKLEEKKDLDSNALTRDRIARLRRQLEGTYAITIDKNISWNDLLKLKQFHQTEKEKKLQAMLERHKESQLMPANDATHMRQNTNATMGNIDTLRQSVVLVATKNSTGSGFFIHHRGYLITNRHVVGADSAGSYATIHWDSSLKRAPENFDIIAVSTQRDLALLKPKKGGGKYSVLRISTDYSIGDDVLAAGFPLGASVGQTLGTNNFDLTISKGSINSIKKKGDKPWFLQNDCAISQGCSGGPLLSASNNRVVGITTLVIDPKKSGAVGSMMAFAIPAAEIKSEFRKILP